MALEHQQKLPTASAHKSPSADGDVMSGCCGELLLFYRYRTELITPQIKTLLSPTPARRRPHGLRGRPPTPAPVAQIYVAAAPGNPPSMRVTESFPPAASPRPAVQHSVSPIARYFLYQRTSCARASMITAGWPVFRKPRIEFRAVAPN